MSNPRVHASGSPVWFELATSDQAGAKVFYGGLFDWQSHGSPPFPDGSVYTQFKHDGREVAACYSMMADRAAQGMSSNWGVYFKVDDVDARAARAEVHGGTLCFPAFDAPGVGRNARINAAAGAGFYVIKLSGQAA